MDDLKLFTKEDSDLEGLLQTVKKFSNNISMSFGLDKCAKATFKRRKLIKETSVELDRKTVIKDLEQKEVYKYLDVDENSTCSNERKNKKRVLLESTSNPEDRTQLCKLHRSNKYFGNTFVTYSFNIINWTIPEIRRLEMKICKLLTFSRMHYLKVDVDRLYSQKQRRNGNDTT